MRLIGTFDTEKEVYDFYSFLLREGIQNIYEPYFEKDSSLKHYRIWVYNEDDLERALAFLEIFKQTPEAPQFHPISILPNSVPPTPVFEEVAQEEERKWKSVSSVDHVKRPFKKGQSFSMTSFLIVLCSFLFLWNTMQERHLIQEKGPLAAALGVSSIRQALLFDDPAAFQALNTFVETYPLAQYKELKDLPKEAQFRLQSIEDLPFWKGIYPFFQTVRKEGWNKAVQIPLFEKIRQGQLWRFFTPSLLHGDFLHILFNMMWVWILMRQVELKLTKCKLCLLILILAVLSNTGQYLASGSNFVGFSGVIMGLAGFIWMRQKKAPWEGYTLQKGTLLFLLLFVMIMVVLEIVLFALRLFSSIQIVPIVANTAHIIGGLSGLFFGSFRFFSRRST